MIKVGKHKLKEKDGYIRMRDIQKIFSTKYWDNAPSRWVADNADAVKAFGVRLGVPPVVHNAKSSLYAHPHVALAFAEGFSTDFAQALRSKLALSEDMSIGLTLHHPKSTHPRRAWTPDKVYAPPAPPVSTPHASTTSARTPRHTMRETLVTITRKNGSFVAYHSVTNIAATRAVCGTVAQPA